MQRLRIPAIAVLFAFIGLAGPAGAQDDLAFRVDRLEAEVRTLSGQVQELTFRVAQLEQMVRLLLEDAGVNTSQANPAGGAVAAASPPLADPVAPAADPVIAPPDQGLVLGAPPQDLGVVPGDPGAPLDLSQLLRGDQPIGGDAPALGGGQQIADPIVSGNPQTDYERAYQLMIAGDYEQAEGAFRTFIVSYPGHDLTDDARFWIGESLYSRQLYRDAAQAFLDAYNASPRGSMAAETLLKLGMSLAALGQASTACATYAQVVREYPDSSNALLQRVAAEQASAGC
ncbi:MAG: tol-pal system protein YbgF [Bauldia sp.]|nr:tol-pal system protein YbgF [Bauldia sp.]